MLIFWITFNFWWSAGLVDGLETHPPQFSSQKNKILVLELRTTSGVWPGRSIDSNPIHHPSPAKKIKSSFLDYIQLLMIGQGWLMDSNPILLPLSSQINKMLIFGLHSTSWWLARLVDGLEPHLPPLSSQKNKMLMFWNYIQLLMIGRAGR